MSPTRAFDRVDKGHGLHQNVMQETREILQTHYGQFLRTLDFKFEWCKVFKLNRSLEMLHSAFTWNKFHYTHKPTHTHYTLLNLNIFDCCLLYLSRYYTAHFANPLFVFDKTLNTFRSEYMYLYIIITIPCNYSRNLLASTNITLLLVAYRQLRDSYSFWL